MKGAQDRRMKHWNLKRVLSLLLVVCMVTGLLSGVSAMAEDQTANYHEISTDGLTLATEDNAGCGRDRNGRGSLCRHRCRACVRRAGGQARPAAGLRYPRASPAMLPPWQPPRRSKPSRRRWPAEISANVLSGETLNVHWNLTLAANAMSVDLPYGQDGRGRSAEGR